MKIAIDKNTQTVPTDYSWKFGVGNDHASMLLRADMCSHLKLIHDELGIQYLRCHGIFDDDMNVFPRLGNNSNFRGLPGNKDCGTVNFHLISMALNNLLATGMKPFVELSFMPTVLASGKKLGFPHARYSNNITMPKDMGEWQKFIRQFITFLMDYYGKEEVESWYFEVWNEPDLGCFFAGQQEDYFKLYKETAKAVKSVDDKLRVGGPSTSACRWIGDFTTFCKKSGAPVDFISTHHYPGDGFGNSFGMKDALGMMKTTKRAAKDDTSLGMLYEELFYKPEIYKGWHRGVLREFDEQAFKEAGNLPIFITEWNSMAVFGAPVHDEKYSAAFIARTVTDLKNQMSGYMFWCASDIFEEMALINEPFHGSYGVVNINGIPKPNFWMFKLLSKLYPNRLDMDTRTKDGVEYAAFTNGHDVQVLVYDQSCDPLKKERTSVELSINGDHSEVVCYRIDDTHCNPKAVWQELGSKKYLTPKEAAEIRDKTALKPEQIKLEDGVVRFEIKTNDVVLFEFRG
jgi:xylan 1,4-beta-xylosidase